MSVPPESHFRGLERIYLAARCNEYYQPRVTIGEGRCELRVEVAERFFHAGDAVHGSVYFKMLDDAAFFAVNSIVEDRFVLTASFNIHMLRPVQQGEMIARGKLVHRSKRLFLAEAVLKNEAGKRLALGSGTFMRSEIALGPILGGKR